MRRTTGIAIGLLLAAGCGGAEVTPDGHEVLVGNLTLRDERIAKLPPGAPVLRIRRTADGYTLTDLVLGWSTAWVLPPDEGRPRRVRFQQQWLADRAGVLEIGDTEITLAPGETAVWRLDGTVARAADAGR